MHFSSALIICAFIFLLAHAVSGKYITDVLKRNERKECTISYDCPSPHEVCVGHICTKDLPCNKDNDCFFYAAADIANGAPHPKCYKVLQEYIVPTGYGICVVSEKVGQLGAVQRLSGSDTDHLDVHHLYRTQK
ncbi:uncharacterized protein LOC106881089 [Octopus bimaculoides]|uniref:uncharacterized protein LOC106881089 n=1 Tax=Octopus bimaculoides TaxID=37653 RepID=UPI00071D381F|nr:uncharacterized protein LOC106881089 [Octopus bimaculoides]|eukprot:XP_014786803.1 PREDICTED: uncharacterized protein LOC106881089 [Octopus bimaculoides]